MRCIWSAAVALACVSSAAAQGGDDGPPTDGADYHAMRSGSYCVRFYGPNPTSTGYEFHDLATAQHKLRCRYFQPLQRLVTDDTGANWTVAFQASGAAVEGSGAEFYAPVFRAAATCGQMVGSHESPVMLTFYEEGQVEEVDKGNHSPTQATSTLGSWIAVGHWRAVAPLAPGSWGTNPLTVSLENGWLNLSNGEAVGPWRGHFDHVGTSTHYDWVAAHAGTRIEAVPGGFRVYANSGTTFRAGSAGTGGGVFTLGGSGTEFLWMEYEIVPDGYGAEGGGGCCPEMLELLEQIEVNTAGALPRLDDIVEGVQDLNLKVEPIRKPRNR